MRTPRLGDDLSPFVLGSPRFKVEPSTIHGNGLFLNIDMQKNEIVTFYDGTHIDWKDACAASDSSYMRTLAFGYDVIDGLRIPCPGRGAASFVNHSHAPNAQFWCQNDRVWIKLTRDLGSNQEVLVNYGKTYWSKVNS